MFCEALRSLSPKHTMLTVDNSILVGALCNKILKGVVEITLVHVVWHIQDWSLSVFQMGW